jgi:thiamine biosynthesis lipoprotein ApbE
MALSKTLTGKEPEYGVVTIEPELFKKIEDHAKQKGIKIDQEVAELLELAIHLIDTLTAAKNVTKGADQELWLKRNFLFQRNSTGNLRPTQSRKA